MKSEATHSLPMRYVALFLGIVLAIAMVFTTASTAQAKAGKGQSFKIPVAGELSDGGTFKGKIVNPEVTGNNETGDLTMTGTLKGKAKTADGKSEKINEEFSTPVEVLEQQGAVQAAQQQSCPILNLDLGPIFLDLLGLQVDLSPINLDVTAVPGGGNLLGNLLCAVAGLLDFPSLSDILANVLNSLLEGLFN